MKKQNENGRISEDRLSRANKRKKNNTIASILVMTGCLLVLVLVTYVAGILYSWIDRKFQDNANDPRLHCLVKVCQPVRNRLHCRMLIYSQQIPALLL